MMRNTLSQIGSLRGWWPLFGGLSVGLLALAVGVGFVVVVDRLLDSPNGKARALCDTMVERLLNSPDATEVMRAGLIVERLNCSLWRRLQ
jgi:hypothetical protein